MHEGFAIACAGIEFFFTSKSRTWVRKHYLFFPMASMVRLPFAVQDLFIFRGTPPPSKKGEFGKKYALCCYGNLVVIGCFDLCSTHDCTNNLRHRQYTTGIDQGCCGASGCTAGLVSSMSEKAQKKKRTATVTIDCNRRIFVINTTFYLVLMHIFYSFFLNISVLPLLFSTHSSSFLPCHAVYSTFLPSLNAKIPMISSE